MKHLKTYESIGKHTFTIVHFPDGEGAHAIYVDDVLEKYGDYYHNKIEEYIEGFLDGAKWSGIIFERTEITCNDSELNYKICDLAESPPKYLSQINGVS